MNEQNVQQATPEVMSQRDVGQYLQIGTDTARHLFKRPAFPRFYVGSLPRVRKEMLDAYLDSLVGNERQGMKSPIVLD